VKNPEGKKPQREKEIPLYQ